MPGGTTGQVARRMQLSPKLRERWRGEERARGEAAFPGQGNRATRELVHDEPRVAEPGRKIGQLAVENDFSKKKPWRISGCITRQPSSVARLFVPPSRSRSASGRSREPPVYGGEPESRQLLSSLLPAEPQPETMALRDQIQKIALQYPAYGYRRITRELERRGYVSNHKRGCA
jgi:hypothetical protein